MHKSLPYVLIGLLAVNMSVYAALAERYRTEAVRVHFLSVGQGDAELVQAGAVNFLIDAGPSVKTVQAMDAITGQGRRTLDMVMLTHPNSDHEAGLLELAKRYDIRLVVTNGIGTTDPLDAQIADMLKEKHIPVVFARKGMDIALGRTHFSVLWPDANLAVRTSLPANKLNDSAIAGVLTSGAATMLFTGDISNKVEAQLASVLGAVDVLKVAHHGSKTSTSNSFLKIVQPGYAVIEAGKNSYGLPTQDVLSRLADAGTRIFRTDIDGTVTFSVRNGSWTPD